MKILPIKTISKSYNIYIGDGILNQLNKILRKEKIFFTKTLIVMDKNVPKSFFKKIKYKIN